MGNWQSKPREEEGGGGGAGAGGAGASAATAGSPQQNQPSALDRSQANTTPLSGGEGSRGTATKWHLNPAGRAEKK